MQQRCRCFRDAAVVLQRCIVWQRWCRGAEESRGAGVEVQRYCQGVQERCCRGCAEQRAGAEVQEEIEVLICLCRQGWWVRCGAEVVQSREQVQR